MVVIWKIIYWLKQILKNAIKYHIRSETPVWELISYRSCGARELRRYRDGNMPIRKRTLVRRYGIREVMAMAKGDVIWKVNECLGAQSLRVLVGERPTLSEAHTWVGAYITKLRFVSLCSTRLHGVLHNPPSPTACILDYFDAVALYFHYLVFWGKITIFAIEYCIAVHWSIVMHEARHIFESVSLQFLL